MSSRTRNYATIVYPDSAPIDWIAILESELIPAFISPLHNRDIEPTGEPKKPHYHVILMYSGVKSVKQVQETVNKINGVGCMPINDIRAYSRYLCHMDSYEKAPYDLEEVIELSGAKYFDVVSLSSDRYVVIREILKWVLENECYIYANLFEYSALHKPNWFRVLCDSGTYVVKEYMRSYEYRKKQHMDI